MLNTLRVKYNTFPEFTNGTTFIKILKIKY